MYKNKKSSIPSNVIESKSTNWNDHYERSETEIRRGIPVTKKELAELILGE